MQAISKSLSLLFLLPTLLFAEIQEVKTLNTLKPLFATADETTWVIFDVDDVLIEPVTLAYRQAIYRQKGYHEHIKEILSTLGPEKYFCMINHMNLTTELKVVEEEIVPLLQELLQRNVTTMALTGAGNGYMEEVNIGHARHQRLKDLGINFSAERADLPETIFDTLPQSFDSFPSYYKGILFTGGDFLRERKLKGDLLVAFLEHFHVYPTRIIFVDDSKGNLENVEAKLLASRPDIHFTGIHYTAAMQPIDESVSFDEFVKHWNKALSVLEDLDKS